ncbi:methylenetetrahydrofolate reductase [Amaricoccus sp.]|uniref:methylenetetrahydrofolate reductase n=1 Tax=Amaricoccus sp. TaxID=1872485 RepID=UPI001B6CE408|nr:methylenetetrahydrofolate reductase [Amaricoccus sp.]MBP7002274.1 methylenetetrahydrofolate reductase [Amaricoccus sp.]
MASILNFVRRQAAPAQPEHDLAGLLAGFSIEVMPRTAAKVEDFRALLPQGTRVYVAHIDGATDEAEMAATIRRLADEGFEPMPHVPARGVESRAALDRRLALYADAGATGALAIAGGIDVARGPYAETMAMLETGLFDARGFRRIHVAGHPEGNADIPGGEATAMAALRAKAGFAAETDAAMAIVTQFVFEAAPVIAWAGRLREAGIGLPVHVGVAGPAKLQTLIKFAMACGVGPSLRVLQRRAADLTKLVAPFEPTEVLAALATEKAANPEFQVEAAHVFPLGGIAPAAGYATSASVPRRARA